MNGPHKNGDLIAKRFEIKESIGEGGMQFVYSARDLVLDRFVAIKTPKNESSSKRFKRSAIVAAKVNHPNVAKTLDYINEQSREYLVEELISGEDLDKAIIRNVECIDPYLVAKIFHYLAKGIAAAHHAGVVHRDLKPTNIMITGGYGLEEIKITDFGIAKMAGEELVEAVIGGDSSMSASKTAIGAIPYMAPEAIEAPETVSFPADIWSVGAMMFQVLTGTLPFGSGLRAVTKISSGAPPEFPAFLKANPQFSPLATQLITIILKCMSKNPSERPNADSLVQECGLLSYPVTGRELGFVREIRYGAWGFINSEGKDVFFHLSSAYGKPLVVNDSVMFTCYGESSTKRAHPVVVLN